MKNSLEDGSLSTKIIAVTYLFRLLDHFASEKNPYASTIYKLLISSLLSYYDEKSIKDHILINFCETFKKFDTIPPIMLLDPLVNYLQTSIEMINKINLFELKLFEIIATHSRFTTEDAILLLNLLKDIILSHASFGSLAGSSFLKIIRRYISDDMIQDQLVEFAKLALLEYYNIKERHEKYTNQLMVPKGNYVSFASTATVSLEAEQEALDSQKRSLIINILKQVIRLKSDIIITRYKPLLISINKQIKNLTHTDDKGILLLLSLCEDEQEILNKFHYQPIILSEESRRITVLCIYFDIN